MKHIVRFLTTSLTKQVSLLLLSCLLAMTAAEANHNDNHKGAQGGFEIKELQYMNFGLIPQGIYQCAIGANGQLSGGCIGNGQLGEMGIEGEPYYSYNVSVKSHGWQNGIKLWPLLPDQSYFLDARGQDKVQINGYFRLQSNNNLKGSIRMTYTFTVNYE